MTVTDLPRSADGRWCQPDNPGPGAFAPGPSYRVEKHLEPESQTAAEKFDDETYPAYSMGRAAEILGVTPDFLRSLDEARLITPQRSPGGHRRYSRYQLRIAARAREMLDAGTALEAACRIIILEDQLEEARQINARLQKP